MERLALSARVLCASIPALFIAAFAASPAIAAVGQIIFVSGDVKVTDQAGRTRAAARGDSIDEGDSVSTAAGASAQLRMVDQGFIAVRSDTEMKVDRYRFTGKEDGKENALMSLVKGGFRTITGIIGRTNKSNYLVRTPAATIGIRGTDHEPFFIPPPAPGQIPIGNPGAYNKVNSGVTAMTTQVGTVVIGANQVAYAASQNAAPTLLPSVPNFFRPTAAPVAKAPAEKPEAEKPGAEKPAAEKPAAEKPAAEKPAAPKPAAEVAEKPAAEKPAAVKPAAPAPEVAAAPKPAAPAPAPAPEPIRVAAVVDNPAQIAAAVAVATAPPPTVAPPPAPVVTLTPTVTVLAQREVTAEATGVTGTVTLNITEQEATAGQFVYDVNTGTTTDTTTGNTFTQSTITSGGQLAIGDFGLLAQTQSSNAQSSSNTASSAVSTISSLQSTAASNNSASQAVTSVSTAEATSLVNTIVSVQQSSPSLVDAAKLTTAQTQLSTANSENAKIATAQAAASAALTDLNNQLAIAQAALGSGATTLDPNPTQAGSTVASACGSAKACADLAAQYATVAQTEQAAQNFTSAQNAFNNASAAASRAASFEQTAKNALTAAQADEATIAAQKTIATNANTAAGTAVTASLSAAQLSIGDFGVLAQALSTNAQASLSNATTAATITIPSLQTTATGNNTTLQAVAPVSTTEATSLINTVVSVQQSTPSLVDAAKLTTAQTQLSTANSENAKIATAQAAASAALTDLNNQLAIAQAALGSGATTLDPNPTQAGSTVASACGSAKACADLAAQYATVAQTEQAAQNFQSAANAFNNASAAANRAATFEQTAKNALTAAQADEATIAAQKTIATNANTAAGTAVTASLSAAQQAVGDFGVLAQFSADSALAAKNSINSIGTTLGTAAGTTAQNLFNSASTANTAAQADATTIANIAAINTATAASNLASITTAANTAASQVSTATSVNTANSNVAGGVGGTDFRDSQAAAAMTSMNTANTDVQGALSTATSANSIATTKSGLLTTAQSSAATQASAATTAFNNAQTAINAVTAAAQVESGTTNANQSVSNLLTLATTAASAAQTAATAAASKQSAGDLIGAQADLAVAQSEAAKAQSYLALAQQIQSIGGVSVAQGALAQLLTDANAAKSAGDAAVASIGSALSTATTNAATVAQQSVIAQYNNPTIVSTARFQDVMVGSKAAATSGSEGIIGLSSDKANTNYVLDGGKNLVEVRSQGTFVNAQLSGGTPITLSNADVKISGGTAADTFTAFDSTSANAPNYVALGRWTGTTASPLMLDANGTAMDLGSRSLHWLVAYQPPSGFAQTRSGTTTYSQLAATKPTDVSGNVGTLNSASLSANFDAQTVTAGVDVSVASKNVTASGTRPISGNTFGGNFSTVTTNYGGDFWGGFSGQKATGAGFGYNLYPTAGSGPFTDLIQGVVAFSTSTAPAAIPQPAQNFATAYLYTSGANTFTSANSFQASGTSYLLDASNDLTMVGDDPLVDDHVHTETISGGTALSKGTATSTGGSTVTYGRWGGTGVSVAFTDGSFSETRPVVGTYHWIKGPAISPFYLTSALTGTASFTAQGGNVTNESGTAGTLDTTNTTLSVNFTQQSVAFNVQATTGADSWRGFGSGVRLEDMGQFFAAAGSTSPSPHSNMAVEFNGSTSGTSGVVDGILMGSGADAAGLGFAFGHAGTHFATGTVAFTGTAQSTSASTVIGIVAPGKLGSPVNTTLSPILGTATLAGLDSELAFAVDGVVNANSRVTRDGASQVTKFDANIPVTQPTGCTSTSCTNTTHTPATLSVRASDYPLDTPPSPGGTSSTTALTNTGSDTTTGIRWGRYVGFVSYVDRIPTTTGSGGNTAISSAAFDARTSNWHAIWMDAQTSKPVLPTSGTVSYTLLGGTNPSDSAGNIATGPATAALSANFTNMTVNASVSSTIGANAWAASASAIPIVQGTYFQAQKVGSAADNLTVTVNSSSANTAGKLIGIFTGNAATGTNGGAMMGYSLNVGGATGTTMQGVSAFKKP